jgi:sarcosine oxidase, subunit alpha
MSDNNNKTNKRITEHPVLEIKPVDNINFTFDGKQLTAKKGEVISSALFAHGIRIFGTHSNDRSPQGIFCANGQCSQCMVIADGKAVKACMVPVRKGMVIEPLTGTPRLDEAINPDDIDFKDIEEVETEVLIIGGGPAGLNAAVEMGKVGIKTLLIDDKAELGGKLTLQTHSFFGTTADCYAGTRGIEIAQILEGQVKYYQDSITTWLNATATAVFLDHRVGVVKDNSYKLVKPKAVLVACGAREKPLAFKGCDLPGVYGAGAFQTLVNRDLIKASDRLFVIGGGNVGVIAAYHALQAGITVVGVVEALDKCGGYKVHLDKIKRLGVPIYTRHTIVEAMGEDKVEKVKIARIDSDFQPVEGTEKLFDVDTVLIAVGLSPIDELYHKAKDIGMQVYSAGDAEEIAEASAAIFSGKITGRKIARDMGKDVDIPEEWEPTMDILKSRPGKTYMLNEEPVYYKGEEAEVYPIIRCNEEIPCDPCVSICHKHNIRIEGNIMNVPTYVSETSCSGCQQCVAVCPGLAVVLVNTKKDKTKKTALLTIPYELQEELKPGQEVETVDIDGNIVGKGEVVKVREMPKVMKKRKLVQVRVPYEHRTKIAAFSLQKKVEEAKEDPMMPRRDDIIICRCERVAKGGIKKEIEKGILDMNILKAKLRCGMGSCGGKTCEELILRIYREMGIDPKKVVPFSKRPFLNEVPLRFFAGIEEEL